MLPAVAAAWAELLVLCRLSLPRMAQLWFLVMSDRITLGFVGHSDATEAQIDAAAFGKVYSNVTGLSTGIGLCLGISTFASQNHGRGASEENGVVFRQGCRGCAIAFVLGLVFAGLSPPLLRAAAQPEELLPLVQKFCLIQVLGLPGAFLKEVLSNTLIAQCVVVPCMCVDVVTCVLNTAVAYWLIAGGLGYLGSAWAFVFANTLSCSLLLAYVIHRGLQDMVWRVPVEVSRPGRVNFRAYMAASLPSAFSLWSEWWAAEALSLLAGMLPHGEACVGAQGILVNTLLVFEMTFVGVQTAATTRIGNLVGMRDASRIPVSIVVGVLFAATLSCAISCVLQAYGASIIRLWAPNQPDILSEAEGANLGLVLSLPPYAIMMCLLGVLRGAGLQSRGAAIVFVSFYVLGLPAGALLALRGGLGLMGVWWGNIVGQTLSASGMGAMCLFVRWHRVVAAAQCDGASAPLRDGPPDGPAPPPRLELGS